MSHLARDNSAGTRLESSRRPLRLIVAPPIEGYDVRVGRDAASPRLRHRLASSAEGRGSDEASESSEIGSGDTQVLELSEDRDIVGANNAGNHKPHGR